jgi:uncharacterized protein with ParB-like and HNH nuclease domain
LRPPNDSKHTGLPQSRSFSIDEYQREYKWERKNIEELVSDLRGKFEESYSEGDAPRAASGYASYSLGSIIVTRRGNKNYLVDGQQRVTSLAGSALVQAMAPRISSSPRRQISST